MGPLVAKYAILFLGQVIDGVAALVHAHADKVPSTTTASGSAAVQVLGWIAGLVVTFIGGKLLRNHPAKDELTPTPGVPEVEDPTVPEREKAAGAAAAAASRATGPKKPG